MPIADLSIPRDTTPRQYLTWFGVGFIVAAFLIATQAAAVGGMSGLLLVGQDSELRPFIEDKLDDVGLTAGRGHDGQIYFAMAHDLSGDTVSTLIENPGIRYRRPVMPLMTSLGGLLEGRMVLWATAFWLSAGFGVSAAALRDLTAAWGISSRWGLTLFLYPGFWMAARLFTPDLIALACALSGLSLFLRRRHVTAILLFTVAALTKEAFVVIAIATGAWAFFQGRRRLGFIAAAVPTGTFALYAAWVIDRFDAPTVDGNFGLPLVGLWNARDDWQYTNPSDRVYIYLTILLLAVSVFTLFVTKDALLRWLILPWPIIGMISSEWIWRIGNGTLRSFAPVILFVGLAAGSELRNRGQTSMSSRRNLPV